jgi:uncharacterized protein
MAILTDAMKEILKGQSAWVATSGADGKADVAIKGSAKVVDDEHIAFFELMGNRTWANVQKNPWVAIAVADVSKFKGYRFEGKAEIITSGPLFDEAVKLAERLKIPVPPKAAVNVKIEEIYDLGKAGRKVT